MSKSLFQCPPLVCEVYFTSVAVFLTQLFIIFLVGLPEKKKKNTLDKCYGNVPSAYKSISLPAIGRSDHDTVYLIPSYQPKIQCEPVVKKTVKCWSNESVEELKGCFDCTDWDLFLDTSDNVSEAADVIGCYVNFCEDMIIPTKTVKIFPNNKPWISKSLKATLNEKKIAWQKGDKIEKSEVQRKLRKELLAGREEYKNKMEQNFVSGNLADAFRGIKTLTGQAKPRVGNIMDSEEQVKFSEELNDFYCRFERTDLGEELDEMVSQVKDRITDEDDCDFDIQHRDVEKVFRKLNVGKAKGPDAIGEKGLEVCASQLSCVYSKIFTWSLISCTVPEVWKNSTICPVPKNNKPKALNDFRPVALTSILMKCFERIFLTRLITQTKPYLDPYQFAYKPNRSTDDATLTLLQHAYTHLEKNKIFCSNFIY